MGTSTNGPQTRHPLRGIGPRVFISYSFADLEPATRIEEYLGRRGFQVRREDETSLLGRDLRKVLPERIGDAEVFVSLLTKRSNASVWVARELEWAAGQQAREPRPLPLLLVLDKSELPEAAKSFAFLDATSTGLTDQVLDTVARAALTMVEPLPLDPECLYHFDRKRIEDLLREPTRRQKRLIADANGVILSAHDDVLDGIRPSKDPHTPAIIAQQTRGRDSGLRFLVRMDQVLPKFFDELDWHFRQYGAQYPDRAVEAVRRFARYWFGRELLDLAQWLPVAETPTMRSIVEQMGPVKSEIERLAGTAGWPWPEEALMAWVMGRRPSDTSSDWIRIGFDPAGKHDGLTAYFPKSGIGADYSMILQFGDRPESYIESYDWGDFCLPQIASRAIRNMERLGLSTDAAIASVGWRVSDYQRMGFP